MVSHRSAARFVAPLLLAILSSCAPVSPTAFNVQWRAPSAGPGTTQGGVRTHQDAMPLGNGALTVLGWSVVNSSSASGGVSFYVGHQNAMSSWTELFRLGQVDVLLSPNPFAASGGGAPYFNQTLDISTASMTLALGGTSRDTYNVLLSLWVDASTDTVFVTAASRDPGVTYSLTVNVTSTRSSAPWTYTPAFATCHPISSQPDVFLDPLPPTVALTVPAPLTREQALRRATEKNRPSATLPSLPDVAAFLPGTLVTYHRNYASDGMTLNSTLTQQGVGSLLATTPDFWADNQFGFALDSGAGPALSRVSPSTLVSASPAASFEVRLTVLVVQTNSSDEWVADLAALVTTRVGRGAAQAWPAHAAFWSSFWDRSYIAVNMSAIAGAGGALPLPHEVRAATAAEEEEEEAGRVSAEAGVLPVPGATFWVRSSSLSSLADGAPVPAWADESGSGWGLSQTNAPQVPLFRPNGFAPGVPGVQFDGLQTFLHSAQGSAPVTSTILSVFRDDGSTGGPGACCSGVVYFEGGCSGISTVPAPSAADDDDASGSDDPTPPPGEPVIAIADYAGFSTPSHMNIRSRLVHVAVTYDASSSAIYVDGCLQATSARPGAAGTGLMVGSRNNELGRYFKGLVGEVVVFPRVLTQAELSVMSAYFNATWAPALPPKKACSAPSTTGFRLSQMYALTRYTQAVQSRNTIWPIKFNGMAFIAAVNDGNGAADTRSWGPSNWWQNTRLPYGAMLTAGDFDNFQVILDYYANAELLLSPRTQLYWGHPGMWTTETHHLSGAYDQSDYGCTRPSNYPVPIETSGYLHLDHGGDSGTGEWALMALDYLLWTGDEAAFAQRYLTLPVQAANYFMHHFLGNVSADGRVIVWPAQVLETYWCDFDTTTGLFTNCCEDDAPTISGMMTLFEKLLALPASVTTPQQRAAWQTFVSTLMPALPLSPDGTTIVPARVLSTDEHNNEGPELYAMHPHRVYTKGREVAYGLNISVGLHTYATSHFAGENEGWNYGLNAAALLGLADAASAQLLERANTAPAAGYRFPAFAPHFQDFDPSADHFANQNRCLLDMLLQSGDDGFANTTVVLFPAWPCEWDVSAKLWGPLNTTVEVEYAGGKLQSLVVTPPSRAGAVKWANCV